MSVSQVCNDYERQKLNRCHLRCQKLLLLKHASSAPEYLYPSSESTIPKSEFQRLFITFHEQACIPIVANPIVAPAFQ